VSVLMMSLILAVAVCVAVFLLKRLTMVEAFKVRFPLRRLPFFAGKGSFPLLFFELTDVSELRDRRDRLDSRLSSEVTSLWSSESDN
jgi:hypothetical protein